MIRILTVIGARPQFIKAGALSREFRNHAQIEEIILHTGQHFDENMSAVFFEEMNIPVPKYHFNAHGSGHGAMTGKMLADIESVLLIEKPDYVLVYGDTNSTLAGALAASKLHIKIIHVEAGLRSFNMKMPEEINRIITDRISNILMCPSEAAIQNLKKEGFDNFEVEIYKCGDVMQDAAIYYSSGAFEIPGFIEKYNLINSPFILCTLHRAENTDNPEILSELIDILNELNKSVRVILPMHPRTLKMIQEYNLHPEFLVIEPVGYLEMIQFLKHCLLVMTDSGGLQKEAYFFRKFCITLREQTEWIELVQHKVNCIAGTSKAAIINAFEAFNEMEFSAPDDLYGGGKACELIVKYLLNNH